MNDIIDIKSIFPDEWQRVWYRGLKVLSLDATLGLWAYLGLPGDQNERVTINAIAKRYYQEFISPAQKVTQLRYTDSKVLDIAQRFQDDIANGLGGDSLEALMDWIGEYGFLFTDGRRRYDIGVFYRFLWLDAPPCGLAHDKFERLKNKISQELRTPPYTEIWNRIMESEPSYWDKEIDIFNEIEGAMYHEIDTVLDSIATDNIFAFLRENFTDDEIKMLNFP